MQNWHLIVDLMLFKDYMMNDIDVLLRFDWGNRKDMPLQRFMEEYNRLSHDEKTKVIESLKDGSTRKNSILKLLHQQAEKDMQNCIEKDIQCIKEYLSGYSEGDIKALDEAALAFAIVSSNFYLNPNTKKKCPNANVEEKSFTSKKKEMLEWILKIDKRVGHNPDNEYLYNLLKDFEYIPEQSEDSLLQKKKQSWFKAYKAIGTGIVRAKNITKGLSGLLVEKEELFTKSTFSNENQSTSLGNLTLINDVTFEKRCKDIDSIQDMNEYTKMKLKLHALKYFVTEETQNLGEELLKVYGGVENYSLSYDAILTKSYDELMAQEQAVFEKYQCVMPHEIEEELKAFYNISD